MIRARYIFFVTLVALLVLPLASTAAPTGDITWIYDGDTIRVKHFGKVRLIGIDAPEREDSDRDNYYLRQGVTRKQLRRVAAAAHQYLIDAIKGQRVRLEYDQEMFDRHGRLLAYVYLPDGRMLNRVLLEKGYAAVYRKFEFRYKADFLAAEQAARDSGQGLWE